jgi:putative flippase GtrA
LGRHQAASLIATAVDFGVMTLSVELLGLPAVPATVVGALSGAVTNFQLGRHWVYAAGDDHPAPQAARYALVSGASAGWNALGEYGLHDRLGLHYLLARAIVAVAVSLLWNFPMHRYFVFRSTSKGAA